MIILYKTRWMERILVQATRKQFDVGIWSIKKKKTICILSLCYEEGFSLLALAHCFWAMWSQVFGEAPVDGPHRTLVLHLLVKRHPIQEPLTCFCRNTDLLCVCAGWSTYRCRFFIIKFDWSIVGLTMCAGFRFAAKWTRYMFMYISSFFGFPSHLGHQSTE